jgi:hypothetical protein
MERIPRWSSDAPSIGRRAAQVSDLGHDNARFGGREPTIFRVRKVQCDPGNVSTRGKEAVSRGLDPDKRFSNVEVVTAEKSGIETTTYVRNIHKYYVSYKLTLETRARFGPVRKRVAPPKG